MELLEYIPRQGIQQGQTFDIFLKFKLRWDTESEPNDFDGANLMYFHQPIRVSIILTPVSRIPFSSTGNGRKRNSGLTV